MHLHKGFDHRRRQPVIHGKTFALPVSRRPEAAKLFMDHAARFGLPFPNFFNKTLPPQITAVNVLFGKLTFNNHLRCNASMIGSRLP